MRSIRYLPLLLLVSFIFLIDLYAYQGLKILITDLSAVWQTGIASSYWMFSVGLLLFFLIHFYRSFRAGSISRTLNRVINVLLTLLVTKLVFCLVLFSEDLFRLGWSLFHGGLFPSRMPGISQLGLLLSAIPFFAFLYGVTHGKYRYTIHRVTLSFEDLPQGFDGFKLVQISDIHAGSFTRRSAVEKGIDLINSLDPDLVVFTGDLVNNRADEILPWMDLFAGIKSRNGKFSVLGNHDYGDYISWPDPSSKTENLQRLKRYHQEMGFHLLLDEHVFIKSGSDELALLGVENWGLGFGQRGNLDKAIQGIPAQSFKLLLSHDPTHWQTIVKNYVQKIHLTLSGHTHGMQFGIEALGIKWSPVKYRYPHWAGLMTDNNRFLYINRGFGFLGFSGRVGIWPEITLITLKKS